MKSHRPWVVRLPLVALRHRRSMSAILRRTQPRNAALLAAFEFKNDEYRFACTLLQKKTNLWAYRSNQKCFCGDFVVVDMSTPNKKKRSIYVLDLKQGAPLKHGGGGAGIQLINAADAANAVALDAKMPRDLPFQKLVGDGQRIIDYFIRQR